MSVLEFSRQDNIATLVMSRPGVKNAYNSEMRLAMLQALDEIRRDPQIRAVILTGAGEDFCAGGDVGSMASMDYSTAQLRTRMEANHRVVAELVALPCPVIAAVDGVAAGAGFSLALAADFTLASERARFSMAFARIGAVPDMGATYILPRLVGLQKARELIYSARELNAAQALEMGLLLEVVADGGLHARADELARSLSNLSPAAFAMTKRLLAQSLNNDWSSQLNDEAWAQAIAMSGDYFKDATARFMRKEPLPYRWPRPARSEQP
ncbi:enoyl-CoA hydratase/isomerase family protein [Pseudomonas sp. GD03860]|uniref:enoyl-CoA hydratase/isomerase family protein n=1 Tax=Pseudomonas TaxID=286 RepID=UPI002363DB1B|nr:MULTISPECIES: enoyl-CoA hydratase/isomerase family protein [Pseudomonas]MDD2058655.1 enoyl-CoA hydratase/isomerase family protein [Pseudomonas putida]MDH0636888.1 enoyl-CoA hydratase/isomerase family protein [Pseudomonas sp. GD03860]